MVISRWQCACLVVVLAAWLVHGFAPGYDLVQPKTTPTTFSAYLLRIPSSQGPFGNDIDILAIEVVQISTTTLRVRVYDPNNTRWEVPDIIVPDTSSSVLQDSPTYQFSYTASPFGFAVSRTTGDRGNMPLFNTTPPSVLSDAIFNGLIFEDQYIEISTQLPSSPQIYGLGERMYDLLLPVGTNYTMWNKDPWNGRGVEPLQGLYGSHPVYIERRPSSAGNGTTLYHGVFLLNSNGMSVELQSGMLKYRIMGGVLDFYIMTGDTPSSVSAQYQGLIGTPYLPPYWALGYHHCRVGRDGPQGGLQDLSITEGIYSQYLAISFPIDVMWNDYDYMDNYYSLLLDPVRYPSPNVSKWVDMLHANGHRYVVIADINTPISPTYMPYTTGMKNNIFVHSSSGKGFMQGVLWGDNPSYFPDFSHPLAVKWWTNAVSAFYDTTGIDGLWIDMNEPSIVECTNCSITQPPFVPRDIENITLHTFDLEAKTYQSSVYNTHNMYGFYESRASHMAMSLVRGKRPFVLSRSTFPGSGRYTAHWLGDNNSIWRDLKLSISGVLQMNMFGVPLVGADICGFGGNATPEMCTRWMQVGAFYPFSRNHNAGTVPQEPYAFPEPFRSIMTSAFLQKLSLSPMYYTLLWKASTQGGLVVNPLFYVFPNDDEAKSEMIQFMLGTALMVSPVVEEAKTHVTAYFPKDDKNTIWYDWYEGSVVSYGGETLKLTAPLNTTNVHLLGGNIVVFHPIPVNNTQATRLTPYALHVGLDPFGTAQGSLYVDDGESITVGSAYTEVQYKVSSQVLQSNIIQAGYAGDKGASFVVATVTVYGVESLVTSVLVNGQIYTNFTFNAKVNTLSVSRLSLKVNSAWALKWQ